MASTNRQFLALFAALQLSPLSVAFADQTSVERVSVLSAGTEANERSEDPAVSADGSVIAFESFASDLVSGDTNSTWDIFVHDRTTGTTSMVSVHSSGAVGNNASNAPAISGDGRFVVFESLATNLVTGDGNSAADVFLHDRLSGTTERVSFGLSSESNALSYEADISSDGAWVAFISFGSNLVPGDTNSSSDAFLYEVATGVTSMVSLTPGGLPGNGGCFRPALSADGQFVAFDSLASDLVAGDTNNQQDVFVHDRTAALSTLVSKGSSGALGNSYSHWADISSDGRLVTFESRATTLVANDVNAVEDVFLHDLTTGVTTRLSVHSDGTAGNRNSERPSITADGRFVAFQSLSTQLVDNDLSGLVDIFVRDIAKQTTVRASVDANGVASNGSSDVAAISSDGRFVAYGNNGSNLVAGDTNGFSDIFLHDRYVASVASRNAGTNPSSYAAALPILGQTWSASVDCSSTGHTFAGVLGMDVPFQFTLNGGQVLLIAGTTLFVLPLQSGPIASWTMDLPDDLSIAGLGVYSQAVHVLGGNPFALTNAQDMCLGY